MGNCIKICRNGRFLVKLGKGQGALHMKIYVLFWYYIERYFWNVYRKEDNAEQMFLDKNEKSFMFKSL